MILQQISASGSDFLWARSCSPPSEVRRLPAIPLDCLCAYMSFPDKTYIKAAAKAAAQGVPTPPEARLTLSYFGAVLAPMEARALRGDACCHYTSSTLCSSLLIFAWTAPFTRIYWADPVFAELLFGCSMLCLFTSLIFHTMES